MTVTSRLVLPVHPDDDQHLVGWEVLTNGETTLTVHALLHNNFDCDRTIDSVLNVWASGPASGPFNALDLNQRYHFFLKVADRLNLDTY